MAGREEEPAQPSSPDLRLRPDAEPDRIAGQPRALTAPKDRLRRLLDAAPAITRMRDEAALWADGDMA
jgi:hypothetical protein